MSDTCETVRIDDSTAPGGYVVINKSDFDPDKHRLTGEQQPAVDTDAARPAAPRRGRKPQQGEE